MSTPESLHALTALKPELLSDDVENADSEGSKSPKRSIIKRVKVTSTRARFRMDRTPIYSRARARGEFWAS